MSVSRFLARYRWELLLFLGIPAAAWFAWALVVLVVPFDYQVSLFDNADPRFVEQCIRIAVSIALLGILYRYVRRQERWFLSLIWRYLLAVQVLSVLLIVIWTVGLSSWLSSSGVWRISDWFWSTGILWVWSIGIALFVVALFLPLHLWFARQASRSSLAHAFFLVLIGGLVAEGANPEVRFFVGWIEWVGDSRLNGAAVLLLASFTFNIAGGLLGAWLLGNFDQRGPVFRRRTIYGLLAFEGYRWLHPGLMVTAFFGWSALTHLTYLGNFGLWHSVLLVPFGAYVAGIALTLALVYLVRVRHPLSQGERV